MGGDKVNIEYYKRDSWLDRTFSKKGKFVMSLMLVTLLTGLFVAGCGMMNKGSQEPQVQEQAPAAAEASTPEVADVANDGGVEIEIDVAQATPTVKKSDSGMVTYHVSSVGRADPFMPSDEIAAFNKARAEALAEAAAHNAKIYEINKLKDVVIREADDISPYSFNLPVPPTSLASENSAAAKITRTKVVGIMYNSKNPSAIINVDDKDYLVRQGDKIMDQEYQVMKINQSWITVGLGSNVYSASIGELFSKDDLDNTRNDLYNLRNRFGGRKG